LLWGRLPLNYYVDTEIFGIQPLEAQRRTIAERLGPTVGDLLATLAAIGYPSR
jgi:hypothetical protein